MATISCDYLIIGSGPGGAVCALELSQAGKDVILIEEGKEYHASDFTSGVGELTQKLYRNAGISPIIGNPTIAFTEGCALGGTSMINGGMIWHLPSFISEEWQKKYHLAGYDYANLKKHFCSIDAKLGVSREWFKDSGNLDSKRLHEAAIIKKWNSVVVPRAALGCRNTNRCATGCPTGAKKDVAQTYLQEAKSKGLRLFTEVKAQKLKVKNNSISSVECLASGKKSFSIYPRKVFLAAGAIQSPTLLQKSGLVSSLLGNSCKFHLNLKVTAKFKEAVNAQDGSIFTHQVQEFAEQGILLMASNMSKHYLGLNLSSLEPRQLLKILEYYSYYGIFVAQLRALSIAKIRWLPFIGTVITYKLSEHDFILAKKALALLGDLLFSCNVLEIYLPISNSPVISTYTQLSAALDKMQAKDLQLMSVHAMASCPMRLDSSGIVNQYGYFNGLKNLLIADASILPDNLGESPQGTIMAFAREIVTRELTYAAC